MIAFIKSFARRLFTDNISFLAGGVAFYGLLALFPAMAGIVSLFGLAASPHAVTVQLEAVQALFPPAVFELLHKQLLFLVQQPQKTLSLTAIFSLILTVFSATRGTKAMMAALNTVFRIQEDRPWWLVQLLAFGLTLGGLMLMVLAVFTVIAIPLMLRLLPQDLFADITHTLEPLRWVILSAVLFFGFCVLFSYGPHRKHESTHAIGWGAFTATAIWVASAIGGSIMVRIIPDMHAAYGSLSAIIALMMWIYISSYVVLIGAAITAEMESIESKS